MSTQSGTTRTQKRIQDGQLGEILNLRAYRMQGPIRVLFFRKKAR